MLTPSPGTDISLVTKKMNADLANIRAYLTKLPPGAIAPEHCPTVESLLAKCWDSLSICSKGGMTPEKLYTRTEEITWQPPNLRFEIERHGATVKGSKFAERQGWSINLNSGEATVNTHSPRRFIGKKTPALDVTPIVNEIVAAILTHWAK